MKSFLSLVVDGHDLSREQAGEAMTTIMSGDATPAQIAGFLVGLRIKGETVEEITGLAEGMRAASNRLELPGEGLVDTCGTGGDGADTFNISTAAALVAAGAGVLVAKHGNRSVSSSCGSADVLEALGVQLAADPVVLTRCLEQAGIAFLFAPAQHPAMKHAIGPRRELGLRTVFNVLGPLTNPAGATRQVVGVYDPRLVEPVAQVLGGLGSERALVVHGAGSMDEISTLGTTRVAELVSGQVRTFELDPQELGIPRAVAEDLSGGKPAAGAEIVRRVLEGEPGPRRDIVEFNAAAAIHVGGLAQDLPAGLVRARQAIDSGEALSSLEALVMASRGRGA